ncbi:hypothetical protein INT46_000067 [Mucor plumbeus]|uniref:Uncharacterized protein n=1 Tax=Mucor plumbeus TaxID=97098 RepID=A0A8H7QU70_9FUNG|nr:hypothetical protein INT46_000067 [Mucor plumbeus]
MPTDSPTSPNLDSSHPNSSDAAQSNLEAPASDWTSTMTHSGPSGSSTLPSATNKRRRDTMMQDIAGRDYYNDLSQAQLVDLVTETLDVKPMMYLDITRASTPVTAPLSVSSARLNLNPNLNFTRTKSGSSALEL